MFRDFDADHLCRSVSQLLPRPVRPIGLGKSHLRSSSFLGDWNSDTSTSKISESLEKSTKLSGDLLNKEYKQKAVINGKADLPRTRTTDLDRQEKNMSDGFDSSGKIFDGYIQSVTAVRNAGNSLG